jgi:hypothetical protein
VFEHQSRPRAHGADEDRQREVPVIARHDRQLPSRCQHQNTKLEASLSEEPGQHEAQPNAPSG